MKTAMTMAEEAMTQQTAIIQGRIMNLTVPPSLLDGMLTPSTAGNTTNVPQAIVQPKTTSSAPLMALCMTKPMWPVIGTTGWTAGAGQSVMTVI